jgi:hypothetical protein
MMIAFESLHVCLSNRAFIRKFGLAESSKQKKIFAEIEHHQKALLQL